MKTIVALVLFLLAACAGNNPEDFIEEEELGQVGEGLSVKPSNEFTHGVSSSAAMQKCTVALGAGASFSCIVPSRTTVRYKISGADDYDDQTEGEMSWRAMVRRAYGQSKIAGPFTYIEEDTANTWVAFTPGNCPGDPFGNSMNAFVCWQPGPTTVLTESLNGTYRKTTGLVTVILDMAAMYQRRQPPLSGPSRYDEAFHQLLEHAVHLGATLPLGNGTTEFGPSGTPFPWSSRTVEKPGGGGTLATRLDFQSYTNKEKCITGSFLSTAQTAFSLQAGTCTD